MANIITTASLLDDSVITLMDQAFLLAAQDNIVIDQFVDLKRDINAKTIEISKYPKLAKKTTPLTDGVDVESVGMSDTKIPFTPAEYGNVVTTTKLANLQTGGKADLATARVVAMNMVETLNRLGCMGLQASTNIRLANSAASEAAIVATDVIKDADLEYVFNRLHRKNIPKFDGELYVALAHPDVIDDLKKSANTAWVDVSKYANALSVLKHEMGVYKGFRWVATAGMEPNADVGAEAVDTYDTAFLGKNALGKAVSLEPGLTITGPFDKLGRMMNIGWYGVLKYGLVDQDSLWVIKSASSYGENT
jgi:N4-gp56 family major capsid protein